MAEGGYARCRGKSRVMSQKAPQHATRYALFTAIRQHFLDIISFMPLGDAGRCALLMSNGDDTGMAPSADDRYISSSFGINHDDLLYAASA